MSHRKATAYLPVVELVRAYFQIGEQEPPFTVRQKVAEKLSSLDLHSSVSTPRLWPCSTPRRTTPGVATAQRGAATARTWKGTAAAPAQEAAPSPLILVFEDLHWIDAESQAFLDSLVDALGPARILLLVNYRPEYVHGGAARRTIVCCV